MCSHILVPFNAIDINTKPGFRLFTNYLSPKISKYKRDWKFAYGIRKAFRFTGFWPSSILYKKGKMFTLKHDSRSIKINRVHNFNFVIITNAN